MGSLTNILQQLDERYIATHITNHQDDTRISYRLDSNTTSDIDEFTDIIGDYYNHHFTQSISHGGRLSASEAQGRAKEILTSVYRSRFGSDFVGAYNDAHDGTNGGLRKILDIIADQLKAESVERHVRQVLDEEVKPNSWNDKVDIIRQFINHCGPELSNSIDRYNPERYAANYDELIRAYVDALRKTSSLFRRL